MPSRFNEGSTGLDGLLDDLGHVEHLARQRQATLRNPGEISEVIENPYKVT
jgi:hypothetical protein